jgi:hypothetical protein
LLSQRVCQAWLNRQGFFTAIIDRGVSLLAVRSRNDGNVQGCHFVCQVSLERSAYIGLLSVEQERELRNLAGYGQRPPEYLQAGVDRWFSARYDADRIVRIRERYWPGLHWRLHFVHGRIRDRNELALIQAKGVFVMPFHSLMKAVDGSVYAETRDVDQNEVAQALGYMVENLREPELPLAI